jgi:hypothetical protein
LESRARFDHAEWRTSLLMCVLLSTTLDLVFIHPDFIHPDFTHLVLMRFVLMHLSLGRWRRDICAPRQN